MCILPKSKRAVLCCAAVLIITFILTAVLGSSAAALQSGSDKPIITIDRGANVLTEPQLISTTPDWMVEGNQAGAMFGFYPTSAGDVNGDGYGDVIVGWYKYDNGETDEGAASIYLGGPSGLSTTAAWMVEGNQNNCHFGVHVSGAGDVNGDGYDDVIVGANVYDSPETDEGKIFVYYGGPSGPSTTADWTAEGNTANLLFGGYVSGAGDVNNDGYDDIITTAPSYTNGQYWEGAAFVYHGSATGLSATPDWVVESNRAYARLLTACDAGDVNGDGYDDVIVGMWGWANPTYREGAARIYLGSATGLAASHVWHVESNVSWSYYCVVSGAGDVNADGYDDVLVGGWQETDSYRGRVHLFLGGPTGPSTSYDWMHRGDQVGCRAHNGYGAGDVNGDGYDDVLLGAVQYDNPEVDEGRAYLYYGDPSGLSATPALILEGNQAGANFGYVSGAGDVNGDCTSDIIIGAPRYDGGETDEGAAYVYHGEGAAIAYLDIKPRSCPNPLNIKIFEDPPPNAISKKGGVLPVAVLACDVSRIDVSSLFLEGVAPLRHSYEDVTAPMENGEECDCTTSGPDGTMDLTLKFLKRDIAVAIGTAVSDGDVISLTLTGELLDGTPFEASDCVTILAKRPEPEVSTGETEVRLRPAVPNPFNPTTRLGYYLPIEGFVTLSVYDVTGKLLETLISEDKPAGEYVVEWNAKRFSSGVYFYRIEVGDFTETRKMILLK